MKDISDSYLDRYRRKLADLESIELEIKQVQEKYESELSEIGSRQTRINNEIRDMRKVITTMIDHGLDPVEAKLRNDQTTNSIWDTIDVGKDWGINSISIDLTNDIQIDTDLVGSCDSYSGISYGNVGRKSS